MACVNLERLQKMVGGSGACMCGKGGRKGEECVCGECRGCEERGDRFSFWKSRTFFVALSFFKRKTGDLQMTVCCLYCHYEILTRMERV